jgi:hypothetical protein
MIISLFMEEAPLWDGREGQLCAAAARANPSRRDRGKRAREEDCQKKVHGLTCAAETVSW